MTTEDSFSLITVMKFLILIFFSSCAYVHHTQISDVVTPKGYQVVPFEILISETGFNLDEAGMAAGAMIRDQQFAENLETLAFIVSLFQMGPRTGNPVWSGDQYADGTFYGLYEKCPSGNITGLQSIRETNKYPVVSGEIVKIRGYCLQKRTQVKRKKI